MAVEYIIYGALGATGLILFLLLVNGIRVIRPWQVGLIEQLGKYRKTDGPGLHYVIPIIRRMIKVDMREQVVDIRPQEVITKDNAVVTIDAVVYYIPTDPVKHIYAVNRFLLAVSKLAQTNIRNVAGDLTMDEALTSRDVMNATLQTEMDAASDDWGVKIPRVEIKRIDPPTDITESMHRQLKAERDRRAMVLDAEGDREASILVAEGEEGIRYIGRRGEKGSAVLEAQGRAEAIVLEADAEKHRHIAIGEGEGEAIETVYRAIHEGGPTEDLLMVKYIDRLGDIADGQATKIFMPLETSGLMSTVGALGEIFREQKNGEATTEEGEAVRKSMQELPSSES